MMDTCSGILIVEDDPSIREVVSELLRFEGYTVYSASNGKDALDQLKKIDRPCLILLDLMMPVMDGWQFLEARKKNDVIKKLPVVVVSAVADATQAGLASTSQVMRKPPDVETLLSTVRRYCGLPHAETQSMAA